MLYTGLGSVCTVKNCDLGHILMQTSIDYYRYFLRFSIGAIYQRLDKRNVITFRIHPEKRRY